MRLQMNTSEDGIVKKIEILKVFVSRRIDEIVNTSNNENSKEKVVFINSIFGLFKSSKK
jgi:hypothetical protein